MLTPRHFPAALLALAVAAGGAGRAAQAQAPLRLSDALAEAESRAFANRQARANAAAERARAGLPLEGILPSARVEAGFVRTTDPIGAFGTRLRQRQVTPAAFDPARLNAPAPINNVQGGVVLEVPVLNADALMGWRAARTAARATQAAADWTHYDVRHQVVRAYYGAVLAEEKVRTLTAAQHAAAAGVRQVERMVQQGLVTKADALQASVRAADVAAQLSAARHDATTAAQQLALLLGRGNTTTSPGIQLPDGLPADSALRALVASQVINATAVNESPEHQTASRADVEAAALGLDAARLDTRRANATLLPRVNGFARYDWNSPTALYAGRPNWTVGVVASWSLFGGGSELADVAGARARATMANVGHEAARAQAELEASASQRALQVALERLDLMTQSAAQSREALRLVDKRYAGGLATIAELLAAETSATGVSLQQAAARYEVIVAAAAHRLAIGADPGQLAALDMAPSGGSDTSTAASSTSSTARE
jgi:outer membrane protein TolC